MNATDKVRERLDGRDFHYGGERFSFREVSIAAGYLSVATDRRRLSIPVLDVEKFLDAVSVIQTASDMLPAQVDSIIRLEMPAAFVKVNSHIDALLDEMDGEDPDYDKIAKRGQLLVQIGNLAVAQRNSEVNALRALRGK